MADFVPGDAVEYIPTIEGEGSAHYIGEIMQCFGPHVTGGLYSMPNTCKFRVTKVKLNPPPSSLMHPYKRGDIITAHKSWLRLITPTNVNYSRKNAMVRELTVLPNVPGLFPGGTNYLRARNRIRLKRLSNLVETLPGPPPGGSLFEGGRRQKRTRRSRRSRRLRRRV
jgi:hypothetical protein